MALCGGFRRSEERSLVKTCSRLPLWSPRSPFHWHVFDMLVMSVGSCVFFHHAEWLGGPRTICSIILPCGSEPQSHCAGLPSCLSSGLSLQCRMGDNRLIAAPSACGTIRPALGAFWNTWGPLKFKCPTDTCLSAVFLVNTSSRLSAHEVHKNPQSIRRRK